RCEAVQDVPFLDLLVEGRHEDLFAVLLAADLDNEFARDLSQRSAEVLVARVPFIQVHPDELDFHRRQAEVVDIFDAVPYRAALARQGEAQPRFAGPRPPRPTPAANAWSRDSGAFPARRDPRSGGTWRTDSNGLARTGPRSTFLG